MGVYMNYSLKTVITRIVSCLLLGFLVFAAIQYGRGVYDFTFIERVPTPGQPEAVTDAPTPPDTGTETAADTDPNDTLPPSDTEPVSDGTGDVDTSDPAVTEEPPAEETTAPDEEALPPVPATAASVTAGLSTVADAEGKGYTPLTAGTYKRATSLLARLPIRGTSDKWTLSTYMARDLLVTEYEKGCIYTEETTTPADRPAIMLQNGFIIRDNGGTLTLLSPDGRTVLADYDETSFRLTNLRDAEGNALFASVKHETREILIPIMKKNEYTGKPEETGLFEETPVKQEVEVLTYYTLSPEGKWIPSEYTDEYPLPEADLGLLFDAPADYGVSDGPLERYCGDSGRWGYRNKETGQIVCYPQFTKAYNYKDGYAICFDGYRMHVLDESGHKVWSTLYDEPEVFVTYNELTLPDTNGIESIGTYYFSHGLTRLRVRENLYTYKLYSYIKSDDYTALYDVNGQQFPIPQGYTLEGYSDGMLLLKKEGEELYGYMNYKGQWVIQPEYTYARPFLSGLAVVGKGNKMGLVDVNGSFVLPRVFDYISEPSGGMVAVYDKSVGWNVYRMMTK